MIEANAEILRIVSENKNTGSSAIVQMLGRDPRSNLRKLVAEGYIDGEMRGGAMAYWITPSGVRMLATLDGCDGDYPAQRQALSREPYRGERRTHCRPGCEDFLSAPSLEYGERVGRRAPAIICGRVSV